MLLVLPVTPRLVTLLLEVGQGSLCSLQCTDRALSQWHLADGEDAAGCRVGWLPLLGHA
jgi:hypothetical protein